jgi:hypothetical protein
MSALTALSPGATLVYDNINAATSPDILDNIARAVWHDWGKGAFTDHEASFLTGAIDRRRPVTFHRSARTGAGPSKPIGRLLGRLGSRFTPRHPQRCKDREASRHRRRMLGGSGVLPDHLRQHYTEGERAVLCIVAGEVKHHGICELPIDKIAALAGVCRTLVQNCMHQARRLGHIKITERPQPGRKNLPNVVEIISPEWRAWMRRGPSAHRPMIGSKVVKIVSTTKSVDLREIRKEEAADEETRRRSHGPPHAPLRRRA